METAPELASESELYDNITAALASGKALYEGGDYTSAVVHLNLAVATHDMLMLTVSSTRQSDERREHSLVMYRLSLFLLYKARFRTGKNRDYILERLMTSIERGGEIHRRVQAMARSGLISAVERDDQMPLPDSH